VVAVAALGAGEANEARVAALVTAGADLAAIEDMIVEAHERVQDTRGSVLTPVCGFAVFALVSTG